MTAYNVLSNQCDEDPDPFSTVWLAPHQSHYGYIVLDLGVKIMINKVWIKNSQNGNSNDR